MGHVFILLKVFAVGFEHLRQARREGRFLALGRNSGLIEHGRVMTEGPLAGLVLHMWWVRWGPPGKTLQRVLSDPVIHLTFETGSGPLHGFETPVALVHGVVPEVFEVTLPTEGRVTGVAFQPGAFATAFGVDAAELTGRVVAAEEVLGQEVTGLRDVLVGETEEVVRREILTEYLLGP